MFVSLLVSGCSLSIQGPAPDRPRHVIPSCDTGKGSVALDGVMGSLLAIGGISALSEDSEGAGLALLATAGLFVASAVRGNSAANECRAAYSEYNLAYERARRESVADLERTPAPRPMRRPPPVKVEPASPDVAPPEVAPPEVPPVVAPPIIAPPVIAPTTKPAQPNPAQPNPAQPNPAQPTPAPPTKPASPDDDDWSAFWKELP
jgi:hypothetical protein